MSAPEVSFVIPHKGREEYLRATLRSIAAQDSDLRTEVIVVTQNPTLSDETRALGESLTVRVILADPALTISALRNCGVRESEAPYIAFLDADIELAPNWLRAMHGILNAQSDVILVSAVQSLGTAATKIEDIRCTLSNAATDSAVHFLPGRNLFLRRESVDQVGGFPEHLVTCEDYYFTDKLGALGTLWYSSDSSYVHLGEDKALDEMFAKEVWRGQSNLQSLRGRPVRLAEWPSLLVPLWITLCAFLALLLAASGQSMPAAILTAAAVLPFSAYVIRLYFLGKGRLPLGTIVAFYGYYFPARAWGTVIGTFRSLGHTLHDR
jgi:glycosyltransferase involved in cell wall biosynthesis